MPGEYTFCVKSEMKAGKPKAVAQRICSINFWKKYNVSVNQAHKMMLAGKKWK